MWAEHTPPLAVEPWLLLAGQWEGFTQASQLQGLSVTSDHEPLPSMEDQLYRAHATEQDLPQRGLEPSESAS